MSPSGTFNQVDVQCPFYRTDSDRRITCEGIFDGSTLTLYCRKKQDYRIQMRTFCCNHYEKCEIYRMLLQKYEED